MKSYHSPADHAKTEETTCNTKRLNGKASNKSFSLGLDLDTYKALVNLQKHFTTSSLEPSRTLITRQAIQRYAIEASRRMHQEDNLWTDEQLKELRHLGMKGAK